MKILYNLSNTAIGRTKNHCLERRPKIVVSSEYRTHTFEWYFVHLNGIKSPGAVFRKAFSLNQIFCDSIFSPSQSTQTCNQEIDCCQLSNPCSNGGECRRSTKNNTRFTCTCPDHFWGKLCEYNDFHYSCRTLTTKIPGKYELRNSSGEMFETFCDFDNETATAWTLIHSYELQHEQDFQHPFFSDVPVNQDTPSWQSFRLSLPVMKSIANDSIKWRATCNYETDGVVNQDLAIALLQDIPILSFNARKCLKYEYINIRGQSCSSCTAFTKQAEPYIPLHVSTNHTNKVVCDFYPTGYLICDDTLKAEDNFGHYACVNPNHRCSSSPTSTTQIWLGGPILVQWQLHENGFSCKLTTARMT